MMAEVQEQVAEVAAEVEASAPEEDAAEEEGPLDLAGLQNKRLGYAAEGLGLEGVVETSTEEAASA